MLQPRDSVNEAYFSIEKRERGVKLSTKRRFLKIRKDADRKRLFCSNVSTLLSLIVGIHNCQYLDLRPNSSESQQCLNFRHSAVRPPPSSTGLSFRKNLYPEIIISSSRMFLVSLLSVMASKSKAIGVQGIQTIFEKEDPDRGYPFRWASFPPPTPSLYYLWSRRPRNLNKKIFQWALPCLIFDSCYISSLCRGIPIYLYGTKCCRKVGCKGQCTAGLFQYRTQVAQAPWVPKSSTRPPLSFLKKRLRRFFVITANSFHTNMFKGERKAITQFLKSRSYGST